MTFQTIKEFALGERIYGNFLVKTISKGNTVQKKEYMDITLGDKTGSIVGKLWDISISAEALETSMIAYATGTVKEWQGQLQLTIDHIEKAQGIQDVSTYIETAPLSGPIMDARVRGYIEKMGKPEIQEIVGHVYEEYRERFLVAPAARGMHHALHGGLAYHTVTMLQTAEKLMEVYDFLDRDLLFAGVILHDIAKVEEMDYDLGAVKDYTRPGYLLGHIVQGTLVIERAAAFCGTPARTKEILQHLVVSHHEKGEWGSPQPPRTPEAIMLHFIDNIDAKMFMVKELLDGKRDGEYTESHRGLRNKLVVY
jgi:3'-5' exoribonuclease